MSTNFNEDDFEEFEECITTLKPENPKANIEDLNEVQNDLNKLELKLYIDFKQMFNINDNFFYEQELDSYTNKSESVKHDQKQNKKNHYNMKINTVKIHYFYLDIEKLNQYNLWENLLIERYNHYNIEVYFKKLEFNEAISLSKRFEKKRRSRKKQKIETSSNVSNVVIKNLYTKYIDLKNIYLNLSKISFSIDFNLSFLLFICNSATYQVFNHIALLTQTF